MGIGFNNDLFAKMISERFNTEVKTKGAKHSYVNGKKKGSK